MNIESIIFDWDDVVTSGSTQGYFECYHETLVEIGISLPPEEERRRILANWGGTIEVEIGGLLEEHPQLIGAALERYDEILLGDTFIKHLHLVDQQIPQLLERLHKKYKLSVATGMHPRLLKERVMPLFKIPPVFSSIVSVYDVDDPSKGKQHPYMIEKILQEQNIRPERAIMVGDGRNDVLMARIAGVVPVVVLSGHLDLDEARQLEVEYIISDVTELEKVLEALQNIES